MHEFTRYWSVRGTHKTLTVRVWWPSVRGAVWSVKAWLLGWMRYYRPVAAELRGITGNGDCYCPTGRTTEARIDLFGAGVWVWLSRDPTPRPCVCDKVLWCLYPGEHAEDIAEYGAERLAAEFPDVRSIGG